MRKKNQGLYNDKISSIYSDANHIEELFNLIETSFAENIKIPIRKLIEHLFFFLLKQGFFWNQNKMSDNLSQYGAKYTELQMMCLISNDLL